MTGGGITILRRVDGKASNKTIVKTAEGWRKADGAQSFPKHYAHDRTEVSNIDDLAAAIFELSQDTTAVVIRGDVKPAYHDDKLIRRLKGVGDDGHPPTIDEVSKRWLMVDFDELPLPDDISIVDDTKAAALWCVGEYLPECFHGVTFAWQASNSAGARGCNVADLHIFFMMNRPIADADLRVWFQSEAPAADPALYQAVQPHYTAGPTCIGGDGPLAVRYGLVRGIRDAVTMPAMTRPKPPPGSNGKAELNEGDYASHRERIGTDKSGRYYGPVMDATWAAARDNPTMGAAQIEAITRDILARFDEVDAPADRRRSYGEYFIKKALQGALAKVSGKMRQMEDDDSERFTIDESDRLLKGEVDAFFAAATTYKDTGNTAPQIALTHGPASGKTERILRSIAEHVDLKTTTVMYFAPTHKLTRELLDRAQLIMPDDYVRRFMGRRSDLDSDEGLPMCYPEADEIAAVYVKAGLSVEKHVCKAGCRYADDCGWMTQKGDTDPGLIIAPHEYLTEAVAKLADILVIDEDFAHAMLRTVTVDLATLDQKPKSTEQSAADLKFLAEIRRKFKLALRDDLPLFDFDGLPTLESLREAGVTAKDAERARRIEYDRRDEIEVFMRNGMTAAELRVVLDAHPAPEAGSWARAWRSIEQQMIAGVPRPTLNGVRRHEGEPNEGGVRPDLLAIAYSRDLKVTDRPMLFADGTADERLLRRYAPGLQAVHCVRTEAPHAYVVQVSNLPLSKTSLAPNKPGNLRKLTNFVEVVADLYPTVGLITYQQTEDEIAYQLPANVDTNHFQNIKGLDEWSNKAAVIVAGRPQPAEFEVEFIAGGHFFLDAHPIESGRYVESIRGDLVSRTHPDELAEVIRWQICDAEVEQAVGRARAIRRTTDNPVTVFILTHVPTSLKPNRLLKWSTLVPDQWDRMAARGVILDSARDAVAAYPDLFASEPAFRTAKKDRKIRNLRCEVPLYNILIRTPHSVHSAEYQLEGPRQNRKRLLFFPQKIPNLEAFLTERLGRPLAWLRIATPEKQAESAKPRPKRQPGPFGSVLVRFDKPPTFEPCVPLSVWARPVKNCYF